MFEVLGNRLKVLRVKNKLSRKQVSELVGISVSMVGFYENGERLPSLPVLVKLAAQYKVSVDYLLGINADGRKTLSLEGLNEQQIRALELTINCFRNL